MSKYKLNQDLYISPTPAGAYYCISGPEQNPSRQLLQGLFKQRSTPPFSLESIKKWFLATNNDKLLDLLYHAQNIGWIEGLDEPKEAPEETLEELFPQSLPSLSGSDKVLLADSHGFCISSHGFPHETAEELSGLSAELASLHERRQGVLENNLGLNTSAWGLVDAAGNSQAGFWPMYIGEQRFVLVIGGVPYLNQPELTTIVWALTTRYGT